MVRTTFPNRPFAFAISADFSNIKLFVSVLLFLLCLWQAGRRSSSEPQTGPQFQDERRENNCIGRKVCCGHLDWSKTAGLALNVVSSICRAPKLPSPLLIYYRRSLA